MQCLENEMRAALGLEPLKEKVKKSAFRASWVGELSVRKTEGGAAIGAPFKLTLRAEKALSELDAKTYLAQQCKKLGYIVWVWLDVYYKEDEL